MSYNAVLFSCSFLTIIKNDMRMGRPSSCYQTCITLRTDPNNFVQTWRSIELLSDMVNGEILYQCLIYLQGLYSGAVVFSMVSLTYQWDILGSTFVKVIMIISVIGVVVGWSWMLIIAGLLYRFSDKTIKSWRREYWFLKKDWRYISKFKKSCRPLCFGDGKRYVIKPVTVLVFLRKLSQNTLRALMTYGKMFVTS